MDVEIKTLAQMQDFGRHLAAHLFVGDTILLEGDLGVGKTELARVVIRTLLGDETAFIPSPSFALIQDYDTPKGKLVHFDAYRLGDESALYELGFPDLFDQAICLIEWPDRLGRLLPARYLRLVISDLGGQKRSIIASPVGVWPPFLEG